MGRLIRGSVNVKPEQTHFRRVFWHDLDAFLNFITFVVLQVRRMEKKANKIAFKSEKQRQEQSMVNTKQQQGKKLWRQIFYHLKSNGAVYSLLFSQALLVDWGLF